MARNEIHVEAPPEVVFGVLADPRSYARWVVGSRKIRSADADWPAPGTAFDHAVGIGPFELKDQSTSEACEPPGLLVMLVQTGPLFRARVVMRMTPEPGGGTRVRMDEYAADGRSRLFLNALTDPLLRLRNAESLRRLKAIAERREPMPTGELPTRDEPAEGDVRGSSRPAAP